MKKIQDKEFAKLLGYPEDQWFDTDPKQRQAWTKARAEADQALEWFDQGLITIDEAIYDDFTVVKAIAKARQQEKDQEDVKFSKYLMGEDYQ